MNELDIGAIILILCSLPFLYLALRSYYRYYENAKEKKLSDEVIRRGHN